MTTIAQVVIEASFDSTRLQQGLYGAETKLQEYKSAVNAVAETTRAYNAAQSDLERFLLRSGDATTMTKNQFASFTQEASKLRSAMLDIGDNLKVAKAEMQALTPATEAQTAAMVKQEIAAYSMADAMEKGAGMQVAGMGRIRMGLTSLIAQYTGTIPVLDRVGGSLLTMGAGGGVALAVVAGIAAIAGAYHFLTEETRKTAEQQDKATESLKKWMDLKAQGIGGQTQADVTDARKKLNTMGDNLVAQDNRMLAFDPGSEGFITAKKIADKMREDYDVQAKIVASGEQHLSEIRKTASDNATKELVANMAAQITAGDATPGLRANAEKLSQFYAQQAKSLRANPLRMNEMTNDISLHDTLDQALHPKDSSQADADKAWRDHIETMRAVVDAYKSLSDQHAVTGTTSLALLTTYQRVDTELAGMTDLTTKHAAALLKLREEMQKTSMISAISGPLPGLAVTPNATQALAGKPEDAIKNSSMLLERAKLVEESTGRWSAQYAQTIDAIRLVNGYIDQQIAREGVTNDALAAQLRTRTLLTQEAQRTNPLIVPGAPTSVSQDAERAKQAEALAQAARLAGATNAEALEKNANALREQAITRIRSLIEGTAAWTANTNDQRAALAALLDLMGMLNEKTVKTGDAFGGIMTGLHGILDAASGLNKIPSWLTEGVNSAEHLVDSLKKANAAKTAADKSDGGTGGIFSSLGNFASVMGPVGAAIGSAIGIAGAIGSMFSQHDAALDKNTQKLDELRAAMIDTKGTQGMSTALADIQQWQALVKKYQASGQVAPGANQGLDDIIKQSGMTLDQFNAIAKSLGIEFSKGTQWVSQFGQALQLAIAATAKYANTLDDQRALQDLALKVSGNNSPTAKINEELALLAQFAPKLRDQLGQIDVTSAEGRVKLRAALEALVAQIMAGTLTPEQLGQLKGVKDLATIIGDLVGGLDSLTTAAGAAASAINGVSWYKINQAIYDVTPSVGAPAQGPVPGRPSDTKPSLPAGPGMGATPGVTITGPVTITTLSQDPEKIRLAFLRGMQRKAVSQFGTSAAWNQVQN